MVDIAKLTVRLEAESAKLTRDLNKANTKLKKFEKSAKKTSLAIKSSFSGAFAGLGVGLTAVGFISGTKAAIAYADAIDKAAKVAGLTTTELQELRFAGEQLGVSERLIDEGFRRLSRRLGEFANSGAGPAQKAMEALNIAIEDSNGIRSTGAIFNEIVSKLQDVETQSQKSALAAQLFGDDAGPKLALLLAQGTKGLGDLRQEAQDIGAVLSEEVIDSAVEAQDSLAKLSRVLKTQLTTALVELAPVLTDAANGLISFSKWARITWGDINSLSKVSAEVKLSKLIIQLQKLDEQLEETRRIETSNALKDKIIDYIVPNISSERLEEKRRTIEKQVSDLYKRISEIDFKASITAEVETNVNFDEDELDGGKDRTSTKTFKTFLNITGEINDQNAKIRIGNLALETRNESLLDELEITEAIAEARAGLGRDLTQPERDVVEDLVREQQALEGTADELGRLESLYNDIRNPADELTQTFADLNTLLDQGRISLDTFAEANFELSEAFDGLSEKTEETFSQISVYAEQAARNSQDIFAEYLFDPFEEDGLEGMLESFTVMLRKMAAQAASADIFDNLFSKENISAAGGFFTGLFSSGGGAPIQEGLAAGGPVSPFTPYLVGEQGPELFMSKQAGAIIPNSKLGGSGQVTVNVNNAPPGTTATANDSGGTPIIDIVLGAVASDIASNGVISRALDGSRRSRIMPVTR